MKIDELIENVMRARRKRIFWERPVYKKYADVSVEEIRDIESMMEISVPNDLSVWLLGMGYGDVDDELSFRRDWFAKVESGLLKDCVRFAQDILGNYYVYDKNGHIFFLSRLEPIYAKISNGFLGFMSEFVNHDYKLIDWINTLEMQSYSW